MSKPTRKITPHDLLLVKSWAKDFLIQTPDGSNLAGWNSRLTDGDMHALAFVEAVLKLLGEDTIHVKVDLVPPMDHDPV
jgi:hypothetical protein